MINIMVFVPISDSRKDWNVLQSYAYQARKLKKRLKQDIQDELFIEGVEKLSPLNYPGLGPTRGCLKTV